MAAQLKGVVMADRSGIEWTEATWNPTTGCDKTSPGCDNCYALTLAKRLRAMGQPKYQNDGSPITSGPNARPMDEKWALDLRDQCGEAGVAFFFKQWGGRTPKAGGRELDGSLHDELPVRLDVS